ncbi:hypothetical protein [Dyadobacter crusticola]|uniref:hypothetical protein n=1 Tax=Dyadobacter crusticola TaxID=292407 RepID=UPI0004E0D37B|nr:hypothetical protein [Dyadobacter crusticola]
MTAESLNAQLLGIYQKYTDSIYAETWENNVSAPLLMHVFDEYCAMENKILFVGQETHSWGQMNMRPKPKDLLEKYREFNLGKSADMVMGSLSGICAAHFGILTEVSFI